MLDGIMARKQGIISSGAATSTLESGILAIAMEASIAQYPDSKHTWSQYLSQVIDTIAADLLDAKQDASKPLDRFSVATTIDDAAMAELFPLSQTALTAYDAINQSLALQKRNPDGGLWYYVYPEWSYLDGVFSLLPFMASLSRPNYTDMSLQISLLEQHCYHEESGLLVHGYDWSRSAVWADSETGASTYVWGRSLAWFLAGLVQTWERLDCIRVKDSHIAKKSSICKDIQIVTSRTAQKLIGFADKKTGVWWQLPTFPGRDGNFLESSSTALFIFALLKGERTGLLQSDGGGTFRETALRAYSYTKCSFVTDTGNGTVGYDKTVVVCSLNSTATYEYYTQRPIVPNGLLGEAAFVLASLEVERL
jgi:unsaturated rhamnogalacturonyl hydrolase